MSGSNREEWCRLYWRVMDKIQEDESIQCEISYTQDFILNKIIELMDVKTERGVYWLMMLSRT